MNFKNYKQVLFPKKTLLINKIEKASIIPNYSEKNEYIFEDPDHYLKLPYETSFQFIVGKKPKGPRYYTDHSIVPYSIVGTLAKKELKNFPRKKSVILNSTSSSRSLRKSMRLSKIKNNLASHDIVAQLEEKKKKKNNMINITHNDVANIFKHYKKIINKNKSEDLLRKNSKDIQKIM